MPASVRRPRVCQVIRAPGFWLLPLLCLLPACVDKNVVQADRAVGSYVLGDYATARELLHPIADKPDQNFVLNNARLGSAAIVDHRMDEAEAAFLRAYEVVNSVGVNSGGRSLGAVLVDEKIRIWKGEPFERAMLNFYLGLIYYQRQDYANARGAFENALFKLRDYDENAGKNDDKFNAVDTNFALGYLMLAKTWQRLGNDDLARANFARVAELRPDLAPTADPAVHGASNLLLVVDYAYGPKKVTNDDGAVAGFAPTAAEVGPMPLPTVVIDGRPVRVDGINHPLVDTLVLAQDRRWQSIDTIRAIKSTLGTGLIVGGLIAASASDNSDVQMAGLGAAALGLLLKATSQADVRQWEMLPRGVFVIPLRVAPGRHDVTVEFPGPTGVRQAWQGLVVPATGEATYYLRMQRYKPGPFQWPPPDAQIPIHLQPAGPT